MSWFFWNIIPTIEKRKKLAERVKRVAQTINISFTVGGGIKTLEDVSVLLDNGADKISINTAAFHNSSIITAIAKMAGSQCVVLAIDTKQEEDGEWYVYLNGGRTKTEIKCLEWAKTAAGLGAGEILLTSMNHDGTKAGYALDITKLLSENLSIPVIASGGGGTMQHFADVFEMANADAALAASVFHFKEIEIPELKRFLKKNNIAVRI